MIEDANFEATESSTGAEVVQDVQHEQVQEQETPSVEAAPEQESSQEEPTRFDQHPRWQEMREATKRAEEEARMAREESARIRQLLEERKNDNTKQAVEERDELLEQMQEVNPQFAERYKLLEQQAKDLAKFRDEYSQDRKAIEAQKAQEVRDRVNSKIEALHKEHKVEEFLQPAYRAELTRLANEARSKGQDLSYEDIPKLYKEVNSKYSKQLEAYRKNISKEYVKGKRTDSSTPTPKTAPLSRKDSNPRMEIPDGEDPREYIRNSIVKSAITRMRGDSEL